MTSFFWRRAILVALVAVFAAGCVGGAGRQSAGRMPSGQVPTYEQNAEVTLVSPFRILIEKAYWSDHFEKPGYSSLPPAIREQQRDQFIAKPVATFLVIEMSITNLSREPVSWKPSGPPIFRLQSAKGIEYASVGQDINIDDLTSKIVLGPASINPNMSLKDKKVFDVPRDEYTMMVSIGRHAGGWAFSPGQTLFKYVLSSVGQ